MVNQNMKNWVRRRWWDFRRGDHLYLRLPISAFSYLTVIYTLLLERIGFLKDLFPTFTIFLLVALILYPIAGVLLGYLDRKNKVFSTDMALTSASNPMFIELLNRVKNIERKLEAKQRD